MQELNQLFFGLYSLILAGLFFGTLHIQATSSHTHIRQYWLLSVGLRALAFAIWSVVPFIGMPFLTLAAACFLGSAAFLAILFRSWNQKVDHTTIYVSLAVVLIAAMMFEYFRQQENSFVLRMSTISITGLLFSAWELIELRKKMKMEPAYLIKAILVVTIAQVLMTIFTAVVTYLYTPANIAYVAQNQSRSLFVMWITLSMHLIVYMFIGSYLYQKLVMNENRISREKEMIEKLLSERNAMINSLMFANRAASTGALSASLAHELSQPLAATMINGKLLQKIVDKNEWNAAEVSKLIDNVIIENRRASNIVLSLKNIFKQSKIELENIDLLHALEELRPILFPQLKEKSVRLVAHIDYSPVVKINLAEFHQVIVNIANNSVEAMEAAGIMDKQITLETRKKENQVEIIISDNGPGIPADLHDSLFELMKTTKESGTGLGLWLSKHIIEQRHGGKIKFSPSVATGAVIMIELPVAA